MRTRFAGVIVLAAGVAAAISAASSVPLGNLILRSQPGAEVTWDGVNLGRTDEYGVMEIGDVPPGQYDLSFTRDGFEPLRVPMDVRAGSQSMTSLLTALPQTAEVPEDTVAEPVVVETPDVVFTPPAKEIVVEAAAQKASDDFPIWPTALAALVIFFAAFTITRLARRRPQAANLSLEPGGPKVVMGSPTSRSGKGSVFMRNLKRREDSLDNFVEAGSNRLRKRVIEVDVGAGPVVDVPQFDRPGSTEPREEEE